jgi:Ala-tRNA(Pro) deacylase
MAAPASQDALFAQLDAWSLACSTYRHAPTFHVSQSSELKGLMPGVHTKNLFLKDAKARLWLVSAQADAVIDLKTLPAVIGSARLSFGSPERLFAVLGVRPGSVSPFALINDHERSVTLVLDAAFVKAEILNFHPLSNDATTAISAADFMTFVRNLGYDPILVEF